MDLLLQAVLALAACAMVVVGGTRVLQQRLMYFPDRERVMPASAGLTDVEEQELATADGHTVLAWWGKAAPGRPTLLYFHGNAGALDTRAERIRKYMARGYGVYMMTYRGFGGSTGRPSERANVADAMTAYDALAGAGLTAADIVIYGESLGSGVATQVAAARPVLGLVLDAPYTSMVDLAALHHPLLPARFFMTDRYETSRHIGAVTAPLLIVHGEEDDIIPVAMGRALYALANEPKAIRIFPGAGHSDHHVYGSYEAIYDWIDGLESARPLGKAG